jgi:putative ABC transport system permease protein
MINVYLVGVDTHQDAMALSSALDPKLRAALETPDSVIIDAADLRKLETHMGGTAEINGRQVRVVGLTYGLRGLGGVNVITSLTTTRWLDPASGPQGDVAYFLAKLATPQKAKSVADRLNILGAQRGFEALTTDGFADRTTRYWLSESGAGAAFIFGSIIAILVAVVITSQTLLAAVSASIKEYAALRALGFSMSALRTIVLAQSFWVGTCGMIIAAVLTGVLALIEKSQNVPIILSPEVIGLGSLIILFVALLSGLLALRRVAQADPAALLL